VAPQLFHRDGSPEIAYDDFSSAMPFMANLTKQGLTNDLNATTDFLATSLSRTNIARSILHGRDCFVFRRDPGYRRCRRQLLRRWVTTGRFGFAPWWNSPPTQVSVLGLYATSIRASRSTRSSVARGDEPAPVPTEIVRYPRPARFPLRRATHSFNEPPRPTPEPRTRLLRRAPQRQIVNCAERPSRRRPCRCVFSGSPRTRCQ